MKILIADDDTSTRTMLSTLLKKFGHEPVVCRDGREAMEAFSSGGKPPPMALIDWIMPRMNGLDVVRHLRGRQDLSPYLILLTSRSAREDKVEGLEAGADDYVVKPLDPEELRARLQCGIRILRMKERLDQQVKDLQQALDKIRALEGILPICSYCKKIRDDQGYWNQVEVYVRSHSDAEFSHSICPECMKVYFPDVTTT